MKGMTKIGSGGGDSSDRRYTDSHKAPTVAQHTKVASRRIRVLSDTDSGANRYIPKKVAINQVPKE